MIELLQYSRMMILNKHNEINTFKEIILRIVSRLMSPTLQKEMEIKPTLLLVVYKP